MIRTGVAITNLVILSLTFMLGFVGMENENAYVMLGLFIYAFGIWSSVLILRK